MMRRTRTCAALLVALTVLICLSTILSALPSLAAEPKKEADPIWGVTSVRLVKERSGTLRLDIDAALSKGDADSLSGENIYLFELYPYQSASRIAELAPVAHTKAKQKMSFSLDCEANSQRLFAKFLIARRLQDGAYTLLGFAHYVDNIEMAAQRTYDYPSYASKKGLYTQLMSDAQELGITHTVINVPVNEYIMTENTVNTVQYIYGNTNYYVRRDKLELLDYKIKQFTEAGVNCYLNILLTPKSDEIPAALSCLYMEGAVSPEAVLFGVNTKSRDASLYFESFLNFIAQRYTSPDREYGFAGSFIIGYQINSNRSYNHMGSMSMDSYLNNYTVVYRMADTAIRSVYSNAKLYVSLANNFGTAAAEPSFNTDANLDYSSREILEGFVEKMKISGDLPWNVAFNAYPSDPALTDFTSDPLCTKSADTQYISMNNIEVLSDFLATDAMLYKENKRLLTVSGFGINSGEDISGYSAQAAMYVLAYYKAEFSPDIEALIYYRHVDNESEVGLNYGLWTTSQGTAFDPVEKRTVTAFVPAERKTIYEVFKNIDTELSETTAVFALKILGAPEWKTIIPLYDKNKLVKRHVVTASVIDPANIAKMGGGEVLYDFTRGSLGGFYPTDNAEYIELRVNRRLPTTDTASSHDTSMLYAKMFTSTPSEFMGIGCHLETPLKIKDASCISFRVMPVAPEGSGTLDVMVRFYKNGDAVTPAIVYSGISVLHPDSWTNLGFDVSKLSKYTQDIDGMKIWIRPSDGQLHYTGEYGLWVESITIFGASGSVWHVILWILLIFVLAVAAFVAFLFIRNYRIRAKAAKRRAEYERKYREYRASGAAAVKPPANSATSEQTRQFNVPPQQHPRPKRRPPK